MLRHLDAVYIMQDYAKMMRITMVENVEIDMDAPTATDDELIDHKKDTKKKINICPCCGVLFDPKTDEVQILPSVEDIEALTEQYMMEVVIHESRRKDKNLDAVIDGKKTISFGQKDTSDITLHKDDDGKDRYIARHQKNENWRDPKTAGFYSKTVLWN